jgi:hypothetical protein
VGDVGRDTWGAGDIVEREGGDEWVELHEQRQRLPDAPRRPEDGHLPLGLPGCGGVAPAAEELGGGSHQRRPHCGVGVWVLSFSAAGLRSGTKAKGGVSSVRYATRTKDLELSIDFNVYSFLLFLY